MTKSTCTCILTFLFLLFLNGTIQAQCEDGETEVYFEITTDAWGYEVYWELLPEDGTCGTDVIDFGGNEEQVGCDGAGDQDATGGNGYGNNTTIETDPICLEDGATYTFQYIDDWGDGGSTITVFQNGAMTDIFIGSGTGNIWEFTIGQSSIADFDFPCIAYEAEIDGPNFIINNEEATSSSAEPAPPGGNCGAYGFWCENNVTRSTWVVFEGPESGAIEISTCYPGTNFDTQIALYRADDCEDFATFVLIASNDDTQIGGCDGGNGFASDMYADCLESGALYYVQLDGWNDDNGDFEMSIISVENPPIGVTAQVQNIACAPDKGETGFNSINAIVSGLDSELTYTWEGPDGFESNDNLISELEVGTYELEVTSACETSYTGSWEILPAPSPLNVSFNISPPTCEDSENGSILANPSGGTSPYEYSWVSIDEVSIVSEEDLADGLLPGNYVFEMEDENGCPYEQEFQLEASGINFSLGNDTTVCETAAFVIQGPEGYEYSWQDGSDEDFFLFNASEYEIGSYPIVLNAFNDEGCNETEAMIVNVEICTNVHENELADIQLYPNPIENGLLTVVGSREPINYLVTDLRGKILDSGIITNSVLPINLPAGMYLVEMRIGKEVRVEKITVL